MSSTLSKRQQARHERTLQDLIKTVPGNDRCADCQARNPAWASWNLGVFLCMRCATLHRKLGTHISKVKSLSMDTWTQEQLESMKRNGNAAVNKIYNPKNIKPPIPVDTDEVDSAMERFIRQKYESKVLEDGKPKIPSREDPSYVSTKLTNDSPPPLPPKPSRRFGFGLLSHSGPSKSSSRRDSPTSTSHNSQHKNKPSRSLGHSLNDSCSSFESKLAVLRTMGFPDDVRNATVLRGFNGDVEKTVEVLVRLGEGTSIPSRSRTPALKTPPSARFTDSYDSTPATSNNPFDKMGSSSSRSSAGLSINRRESHSTTASAEEVAAKKGASYNPFDVPLPPASGTTLEQSFQNLQVSPPLFPNMTGGYPSQQTSTALPKYQSMTPPVTMASQNGLGAPPVALNGGGNPFFQSPPAIDTTSSNIYLPQSQNLSPTNPFFSQISQQTNFQPQPGPQPPSITSVPEVFRLQHANTMPLFPLSTPQQQQPQFPQSAPITPVNSTATQYFAPQYPQQQQQYFQTQQPRLDKSSILALYNFSKPPPTILEQPQSQPESGSVPPQVSQPTNPFPTSVSNPVTPSQPTPGGTRNPFFSSANAAAPHSNNAQAARPNFIRSHMSQESMDIGRAQAGRHSPDVFASLSARYG